MNAVSPEWSRRRPRPLWLGSLILSSVIHAAALPLIGGAWFARDKTVEQPQIVEVTLTWMAPAAEPQAKPAPVTPAAESMPHPQSIPAAEPMPAGRPSIGTPLLGEPIRPPPKAGDTTDRRAAPHRRGAKRTKPPPPTTQMAMEAPPSPAGSPGRTNAAPHLAAPSPPAMAEPSGPSKAEALTRYSRGLLDLLERHKVYPLLSQRRGEQGTIVIRLTLAEDGHLLRAEPLGGGPGRLIEASLAAVQAAAPFPPLPAELGGREAVFNVPITYRLQ